MFALLLGCAVSRRSYRHHMIHSPYHYAEANGAGTGVVSAGGVGLNIRSGPGTNNPVIGSAADGSTLSVTGYSNNWWQVNFNGRTGYCSADYLIVNGQVNSNIGVNIRAGPGTNYGRVGGLGNGAGIKIKGISSNWFKIDQGWVCADYINLVSGPAPGPAPGPSGQVIRQGDPRFNANIRRWGCGFMSLCWLGGVNSIDGCNANYNRAIANGWMRSDCYILSWEAIKPLTGARTYRYGGRGAGAAGNEKEILQCQNARTSMHFVVGNKAGGIEYDPAYVGSVAYNDHVSKRFYGY